MENNNKAECGFCHQRKSVEEFDTVTEFSNGICRKCTSVIKAVGYQLHSLYFYLRDHNTDYPPTQKELEKDYGRGFKNELAKLLEIGLVTKTKIGNRIKYIAHEIVPLEGGKVFVPETRTVTV